MYNSSQMCVMNSGGVQKYMGGVDGTIKDFFKLAGIGICLCWTAV